MTSTPWIAQWTGALPEISGISPADSFTGRIPSDNIETWGQQGVGGWGSDWSAPATADPVPEIPQAKEQSQAKDMDDMYENA